MMAYRSKFVLPNSQEIMPLHSAYFFRVEFRSTSSHEHGLFVLENVLKDSCVMRDGGLVVSSIEDLPSGRPYSVVIDENLFLSPSDFDHLEPISYLNHSCTPNLIRVGSLVYLAKRDLVAGEELTVDYSPLIAGVEECVLKCDCKAPDCRKMITGNDWKDKNLQEKLWVEWPPHIQRKIQSMCTDYIVL